MCGALPEASCETCVCVCQQMALRRNSTCLHRENVHTHTESGRLCCWNRLNRSYNSYSSFVQLMFVPGPICSVCHHLLSNGYHVGMGLRWQGLVTVPLKSVFDVCQRFRQVAVDCHFKCEASHVSPSVTIWIFGLALFHAFLKMQVRPIVAWLAAICVKLPAPEIKYSVSTDHDSDGVPEPARTSSTGGLGSLCQALPGGCC